jgi:hypothetical protein
MNNMAKGIVVAIVAGLIAWGAWVTLGVANAATQGQVSQIQQRIEDKLDKIQETILDLHKGE